MKTSSKKYLLLFPVALFIIMGILTLSDYFSAEETASLPEKIYVNKIDSGYNNEKTVMGLQESHLE